MRNPLIPSIQKNKGRYIHDFLKKTIARIKMLLNSLENIEFLVRYPE